jgi:hypothetical protein
MPYTHNCDLYLSVREGVVNATLEAVTKQRPSLFNYLTPWFALNQDRLCRELYFPPNGAAAYTPRDPITFGHGGNAANVDYAMQLRDCALDIHPFNIVGPPPEIADAPSGALIRATMVGRISVPVVTAEELLCPEGADVRHTPDYSGKYPPTYKNRYVSECFSVTTYALFSADYRACRTHTYLTLFCDRLEFVDFKPADLEEAVERTLLTLINAEILPGLWTALSVDPITVIDDETLTITVSPAVGEPKPMFDNDEARLYFDLEVA